MVVEDDLRYVAPCVLVWMGLKIEFKTKERENGNEWCGGVVVCGGVYELVRT